MAITASEAQVRENFSTFLNRVQDGAEIIIERDNVPIARLLLIQHFGEEGAAPKKAEN